MCLEEEEGVGRLCPGARVLRVVPRGVSRPRGARRVKLAGAGRAGMVSLQKESAPYPRADERL